MLNTNNSKIIILLYIKKKLKHLPAIAMLLKVFFPRIERIFENPPFSLQVKSYTK